MLERWERRLQALAEVHAPSSIDRRLEEGPRSHDVGPTTRGRLAAGLVAFAVFAAAGAFAWRAFDDDALVGALPSGAPGPGRIAFTASVAAEQERNGIEDWEGDTEPPRQIYTVNPDGSDLRMVTEDPSLKGSLVWSPDGSTLAFTSYDVERDVEQLSVMAADGSGRRIVCESCTGTFSVDSSAFEDCVAPCGPGVHAPFSDRLTWSPDGAQIAAPLTHDRGLALIALASSEVREVEVGQVSGSSWSPDGTQLAVSVDGDDPGLFIVDAATTSASELLAADPYSGGPPAWSPDGSTIAFAQAIKVDGGLRAELVFVDPDEGGTRTVLGTDDLFEIYDLKWSPNGSRLAVLHHPVDPPTAALLTVAADGSDVQMLALCENGRDTDGLCSSNGGSVSWSSDGRSLAFLNGVGDRAFTVVTLGGRDVPHSALPVSGDLVPGCCLAWAPSVDGPPPAEESSDSVTVPDVIGLRLGDARAALDQAGLDVGMVTVESISAPERGVVTQVPAPGSVVLPGTAVDLSFVDGAAAPGPEASPSAPSVAGSTWQLTAIDGTPVPQLRRPITVIFSDDRVGGFDGCNGYGGKYQLRDGTIDAGRLVSTAIGCEREIMDRSEAMFDRLIDANVRIEGTTLTLSTDAGTATFDRLDVEILDNPGAALDCAPGDRVPVVPHAKDILLPAPPSYISVNLSGIRRSELVQVSGSEDAAQPSTWNVVRDGQVIGVIDVPTLDGTACRGSGIEGI